MGRNRSRYFCCDCLAKSLLAPKPFHVAEQSQHIPVLADAQALVTKWNGTGRWTSAAHWGHGVPTVFTEATVDGETTVTVPTGDFKVAWMDIGTERGDHVRVLLMRRRVLKRGQPKNSLAHSASNQYAEDSPKSQVPLERFRLYSLHRNRVKVVFLGGTTQTAFALVTPEPKPL